LSINDKAANPTEFGHPELDDGRFGVDIWNLTTEPEWRATVAAESLNEANLRRTDLQV
jgi:hypothetical protein